MADLMQQARELLAEHMADLRRCAEAVRAEFPARKVLADEFDKAEVELEPVAAALRGAAPAVEELPPDDKETALGQAVELAQYVERQAKGSMRDEAARFLSLPYAQDVDKRLRAAPPEPLRDFLIWAAAEIERRDQLAGNFSQGIADSLRGRAYILREVARQSENQQKEVTQ